jgi:hypothetical protein
MLVLGGIVLYGLATVVVVALGRAAAEPEHWEIERRIPVRVRR